MSESQEIKEDLHAIAAPEIAAETLTEVRDERAQQMIDEFEAARTRAKEALLLAQIFQRRAYNQGRLTTEFEEGDQVVLNPHSLNLLRDEKGRGKKLLMRYDGPFEIIKKLSPVSYQLRMPISYGIHPVLNIAHLEPYKSSPPEFGTRPTRALNRKDFQDLPEVEIERIIAERWKRVRGRRVQQFKVRWMNYGPEHDEWLTKSKLKNAPEPIAKWMARDNFIGSTLEQEHSSITSTRAVQYSMSSALDRNATPTTPIFCTTPIQRG